MTANRQRAEVEVKGTGGTTHRFRLGTGAICRLEEILDMDVMQLFERLQQGKLRLGIVREFVKASSMDTTDMSNEHAEALIDDVGVMPMLSAMTDSILLTFNIERPDTTKAKPKPNGAEAANPLAPGPAKRSRRGGGDTSNALPHSAH